MIVGAWLAVTNLFALFVLNRFNLLADTAYRFIGTDSAQGLHSWNIINLHSRYDSVFYLRIAKHGYWPANGEDIAYMVFLPAYPFLTWLMSYVTSGRFILAGWFVSMISLTIAALLLFKLVKKHHPEIDPYLPLILLLIFPTAFFLNAVYTESLYLLFAVGAFYFVFEKKYAAASAFAFGASLTKVTGVLLFIPLVWEYMRCHDFNWRAVLRPQAATFLVIPAGTFAFLLHHYFVFGDFFKFFKVDAQTFGRTVGLKVDEFTLNTSPAIVNFGQDIFFAAIALTATFFVLTRVRTSYGLFMAASLAVALATGPVQSIGRYALVLFPMFIWMASVKNEWARLAWPYASVLLLAVNIICFTNEYWAG